MKSFKTKRLRIFVSWLVIFAMMVSMVVSVSANGGDSYIPPEETNLYDEFELLRELFYSDADEPLTDTEVVFINDSKIIHVPQEYVEPAAPSRLRGTITPLSPGPFALNVERDFYDLEGYTGVQTAKLVKQGTNCNVWVVNDGIKYNYVTETNLNAIVTAFDGIYTRMTNTSTGLAPFVKITTTYPYNYSNLPEVGNIGNDEKVNILLYDIGNDGMSTNPYTGGFFNSGDFFTYITKGEDQVYQNHMAMIHMDIGTNQGYKDLADDPNLFYSTLAHEFQHMLFYMTAGYKMGEDQHNEYTWFNEALSALAEITYTTDGELLSTNRLIAASINSYGGEGYGDFLHFNGSLKNYGMVYLHSLFMHRKTALSPTSYGVNVYNSLKTASSFSNSASVIGAAFKAALGSDDAADDVFRNQYYDFMEAFAADGGGSYTKFVTPTPETGNYANLWAIRQALGGNLFKVGSSGEYTILNHPAFPTISDNDGPIKLVGYNDDSNLVSATHEMMYKIGTATKDSLEISIDGANSAAKYYVVVPADDTAEGATVTLIDTSNTNNVNYISVGAGKIAYLFVSTFKADVTTSTVAYNWIDAAVDAETPTITTQPAGGSYAVGSSATLTVAATSPDSGTLTYQWYSNTTNSATGGTSVGTSATYTPPTTTVGTTYYYVVVTNTNNGVTGTKTATATSSVAEITVTAAPKTQVTITASAANGTYDGSAKNGYTSLSTTPTYLGTLVYTYTGTGDTTYSGTTAPTNAGTYSLVISILSTDPNYEGTSEPIEFTIGQKPLTGITITVTGDGSLSYTGSELRPAITVTDSELSYTLVSGTDYTIMSYVNNTNAGTATVNIIATSTGNYTGNASKNFSIAKGTTIGTPQTVNVVENYAQNYTFDLTKLLPAVTGLTGVAYSPVITENYDSLLETLSYTTGNTLTLPIQDVSGIGKTATVTVTITSDNYTISDAIITITTTDKTAVTIEDVEAATGLVYDGTPQEGYTGIPTAGAYTGGFDYSYTGTQRDTTSYGPTEIAPKKAGDYSVTISIPATAAYTGTKTLDFTIAPKGVTITGVTVDSKEYDGNNTATITNSGVISDAIAGDTVTVSTTGVTAAFDNKNFGTGKTITFTGNFTLGGSAADNYVLLEQPTGVTANITKKSVTLTGVTVGSKEYDGNNTVTITNSGTLSENFDGVTLTIVPGTAAFADKNVGDNKTITFTGFALGGSAADNYVLLEQPTGVTANITKKSVTITGVTVGSKEYDGDNTATIIDSGTLSENFDGVNLTIVKGTATFDDGNVGVNKTVTFTGFALGGDAASNYTLSGQPANITTGEITAKQISGVVTISSSGVDGEPISIGNELTADITGIEPTSATLSYAWSGTNVAGTNNTYTVVAGDAGATITVTVTGTGNYEGTLTASVEVGKTPLTGTISIDEDNGVLTLNTTSLSGITSDDYTIQWLRDGMVIDDEIGISYTIIEEDLGKTITLIITGKGTYTGTLSDSIDIPAIAPDAPQNLTAAPGDSQVTLTWEAPAFDGGSAITHYEVYDVIADNGTWKNAGLNTSYVYTGLTNDTTYTFRVCAVNSAGNGAAASTTGVPTEAPVVKTITVINTQNGTPTAGTAGSATFNVTAENISNGTYPVTLNGTIPTGITADDLVIAGNTGTLTITTTADVPAGTYTMTITVDGVTSNPFDLVVNPAGSTPPGATTYHTITATVETGGSISPSGSVSVADGASRTFSITPNADYAINDVVVDGVSQGAISTFTFTNVTANHTITATFTYTGGTPIVPPLPLVNPIIPEYPPLPPSADFAITAATPAPTSYIPTLDSSSQPIAVISASVVIDGKAIETSESVIVSRNTALLILSQAKFANIITSSNDDISLKFPTIEDASTFNTQLTLDHIDMINSKDIELSIQIGNIIYAIAPNSIDTGEIKSALGATDLAKISFTLTINIDSDNSSVNNAVVNKGGELVIPAVSFTITAKLGDKTVEVANFDRFITRTIGLTAEQAAKITTAVIVNPSGSLTPVPTNVYKQGGKWYTDINSMTNSTYALITYEKTFADTKGKWYEESVKELASRMVINGRSDTVFDGDGNITRAEFCALIVRALGLREVGGNASMFSDVKKGDWYYGAIGRAYEYGIVSGRGNGLFDPNTNITWQEAMVMIQRAASLAEYKGSAGDVNKYADAGQISDWAKEAAKFCVGSRLLAGNNDGKHLNPQTYITRAETADVILKLLQRSRLISTK